MTVTPSIVYSSTASRSRYTVQRKRAPYPLPFVCYNKKICGKGWSIMSLHACHKFSGTVYLSFRVTIREIENSGAGYEFTSFFFFPKIDFTLEAQTLVFERRSVPVTSKNFQEPPKSLPILTSSNFVPKKGFQW